MWALYLHVKDEVQVVMNRDNVPEEQIWVIRHDPSVVCGELADIV